MNGGLYIFTSCQEEFLRSGVLFAYSCEARSLHEMLLVEMEGLTREEKELGSSGERGKERESENNLLFLHSISEVLTAKIIHQLAN